MTKWWKDCITKGHFLLYFHLLEMYWPLPGGILIIRPRPLGGGGPIGGGPHQSSYLSNRVHGMCYLHQKTRTQIYCLCPELCVLAALASTKYVNTKYASERKSCLCAIYTVIPIWPNHQNRNQTKNLKTLQLLHFNLTYTKYISVPSSKNIFETATKRYKRHSLV